MNNTNKRMDNNKSFDFASGVTKLLISLATGVITITITFGSNSLSRLNIIVCPWMLLVSWILLVISIASGIIALQAMTGTLSKDDSPNIYANNIRAPEIIQILFFGIGIIFSFIFSYINITEKQSTDHDKLDVYSGQLKKTYYDKCHSLRTDTIDINLIKASYDVDSLNAKKN